MVASTRIDLIVERSDDEVVGALGAFWDPHRKPWFVDAGAELKPFLNWLPEEGRLATANGQAIPGADAAKGISLSAFLVRVKEVINAGLPDPVWVRAEIHKVQKAKSGHVYLELEE